MTQEGVIAQSAVRPQQMTRASHLSPTLAEADRNMFSTLSRSESEQIMLKVFLSSFLFFKWF